jgi:hypothetical protein
MKGFTLGLSVSIAFVLGCAAAPLVLPANAQSSAPEGVQRWEYSCDERRAFDYIEPYANEMGAAGWELVSIAGSSDVCFKRPL